MFMLRLWRIIENERGFWEGKVLVVCLFGWKRKLVNIFVKV